MSLYSHRVTCDEHHIEPQDNEKPKYCGEKTSKLQAVSDVSRHAEYCDCENAEIEPIGDGD